MKILVHAPNWVGDHVMAFPFYRLLPELFPQSRMTLIGRSWISSLKAKTFHQIITFDEQKNFSRETLKNLKAENFDLAITLSPSFRSALLLYRLGCQLRIGYKGQWRSPLLKFPDERGALRIPPYNPFEHRSLSYLRLLTPFYSAEQIAESYFSRLGPLTETFTADVEFLKSITGRTIRKILTSNHQVLAICPGSVAPSKIYPVKHLVQVAAEFLAKSKKRFVILIGSGIEKKYAAEIKTTLSSEKRIFDITGQTTLMQLAWLLQQVQVLVANDSGIGHLSTLTGTPLVSFQGMGRKEETVPLNPRKVIFHRQLPCSPCFKKTCPRRDFPLQCLEEISPASVNDAIENLISRYGSRKS